MNSRQRESTAKFLYDLAKGLALLIVVSPWVTGHGSLLTIVAGAVGTGTLFAWAYWLERKHDDNTL